MNRYDLEIDEFDYQGDLEVYRLFKNILPEHHKMSKETKKSQEEFNLLKVKIKT